MRLFRTTVILMAMLAAATACSRPPADDSGDWCTDAIAALTGERQRWYDYDKSHGGENEDLTWMIARPNPPATAQDIDGAEQRLGKRFDRQFRQWLEHANGWPFFFGTISLFSTDQLTKESRERSTLLRLLGEVDKSAADFGVRSLDDLILIGTDDTTRAFVLTVGCEGNSDCDSAPVWETEGEIRRFDNLRDYLTSTVEELKTLKQSP
ncbi:hypothetical protein DFR70_111182 [Nocardia tenerifensis]|uniref:Knr4/Smi1-like domain-containing protein n=1 Tax=Nocardia tenerifensis TaxID=228006 RepID=A0A318K7N1_9NOCA|nr:SMI1/KNR4 family protein [Nocardia tenerifensis]PXX59798.1 hypothetical protein DFR70_111182 [Nocardia tenerifensis]